MFHYIILSLCSNTLTLESIFEYIGQKFKKHTHFKISSRDDAFFFFFSSGDEISSRQKRINSKRAFTCNRDEISSRDETRPGMKKFLFTCEFHPGMKRVEFHPGMKFNLKENLSLSMEKY